MYDLDCQYDDPICGLHASCSGFVIPEHKCTKCISKIENPFYCLGEKCLGESNVFETLQVFLGSSNGTLKTLKEIFCGMDI